MWNLKEIENSRIFQKWFLFNSSIYNKNGLQEKNYRKFLTDRKQINDYILEIQEWCKQEAEIPEEAQDEEFIEIMLQRNKYRLERTKIKIKSYFQSIQKYDEVFTNLGHVRLSNQVCYNLPIPGATDDHEGLILFRMNRKNGKILDIEQAVLTTLTTATLCFHYQRSVLRLRFILDFDGFPFSQFVRIQPNTIFMLLDVLENILSISIAGIEIINSPFYLNLILALFKMTIKPKLLSRITVHKSLDSLHQTIPQHYLPVGYGSNPVTVDELCAEFDEIINKSEAFYEKIASFSRLKT